jgi:hypothetical protein
VRLGLSLPEGVLVDHRFRGMSAEQIYNLREREAQEDPDSQERKKEGSEPGSDGASEDETGPGSTLAPVTEGGVGQVLDAPLPDEETPSIEEQAREWSIAVNQAATVAKQAGKAPAGLDRALKGAAEAAVDWAGTSATALV